MAKPKQSTNMLRNTQNYRCATQVVGHENKPQQEFEAPVSCNLPPILERVADERDKQRNSWAYAAVKTPIANLLHARGGNLYDHLYH